MAKLQGAWGVHRLCNCASACNATLSLKTDCRLCSQVPLTVPINSTTVNGTSCEVSYSLTQAGQATTGSGGDRDYLAFLQLTLANSATNAPIAVPYTLTLNNTNYVGVTQSNGLDLTDSSAQAGLITGNVDDYWNTLWPAATNNVTISLLLQGTDADLAPSQVSSGRMPCQLCCVVRATVNKCL